MDEANLPDAIIPAAQVPLGIAPAGTSEEEVAFDVRATLTDGDFSGSIDASSLPSGDYELWAKACLGEACGMATSASVTLGAGPTPTPTPSPTGSPSPTPVGDVIFEDEGFIEAFSGPVGITLGDFIITCAEPTTQGLDGYAFELPEETSAREVVNLTGSGSTIPHDLDLYFYDSDCNSSGDPVATESADEIAFVPNGTKWLFAHAFTGVQTTVKVAVYEDESGPEPSASPTESVGPTPDPSPTEGGKRGSYPETPNDPYVGEDSTAPLSFEPTQWALRKVQAPQAWQQLRATGFGIRVAVLDTGVDLQHEDLQCAGKLDVGPGSDVVNNDPNPDDEFGHGTRVAGIIGACTNNGTGVAGVAPDATIVPVRVLNASGSGTDAQLIAGLDKATELGVHVVNLSLGYPPGKDIINNVSAIDAAIGRARDAGIVLVAVAGNDSFPLCEYPALAEDVICVGATDPRDVKAAYSVFPNKTDAEDTIGPGVVAPGGTGAPFCDTYSENILSTIPLEFDNNGCTDVQGYANNFGTSMAAPHVAGVAALVYDRLGGVRSADNAVEVIDALVTGADDLGVPGYDPVFGFGRINALSSVQAIAVVDPDPTSTPTDDPSSTPTDDPTTDPGPTTPAAPSNLTARAASSSRIELAWSDNSNNETSFAIERSLDGSGWQEIATGGRDQTMHLDMGLDPDTSYFYRVRALIPSGYSAYSNTASATTIGDQSGGGSSQQAPEAPTNVAATSSSPSRIEVSWADKSNNEDGFALERSANGNSWQEIATTGRNQTSYLDTGLAASTTYQYRVRAYNSVGHSVYSNVASAKTTPAADGEPSPDPSESSQPVEPVAVGSATTSIAASRELVAFNKGLELSGVVERDDNCTGPLEIEVSRRIHGTRAYEALASTPVNGAGAWGLQINGKRNAAYVGQVKETDGCQGDASVPTDVLVRAKIAVRIPNRCGGAIRGRVLPANQGEVVLQRRVKGRWVEVTTDALDSASRYALRAKRCGLHRITWSEDGATNEPARKRFRL